MTLSAISTTLSSALSSMHNHGRRKGGRADLSTTSSGTSGIGQPPAGVSSSLFSNLVQSFQQSVGAQSSSGSTQTGSTPAVDSFPLLFTGGLTKPRRTLALFGPSASHTA